MAAATYRIRSARPDDATGVGALLRLLDAMHARLVPGFFNKPEEKGGGQPDAKRDAAMLARLLHTQGSLLLVAERTRAGASDLVGLLFQQIYETPADPSLRRCRRVHVESLVVDPRCRRRGLGRTLLETGEAWAKQLGAVQMVLTVWSGNAAGDRFYDALGYRTASRVMYRELT